MMTRLRARSAIAVSTLCAWVGAGAVAHAVTDAQLVADSQSTLTALAAKGGLMFEASLGGQKFGFEPFYSPAR